MLSFATLVVSQLHIRPEHRQLMHAGGCTGHTSGPCANGGGAPAGGGGGGGGGGSSITCATGSNYVGSASLAGTAAATLGALGCVDTAAVAYRATLSAAEAGTGAHDTVNIYGPFENGFTNSVPGLSCLGTTTVDGGIDTYTAELMVQNVCGSSTEILNTCGDHATPRHFHE
jgi:hypothetical protein